MASARGKEQIRTWLPALGLLVLFVIVAECLLALLRVPPYVLPKPSSVAREIVRSVSGLLKDAWITSLEAVAGFALAAFAGMCLAVGFCLSKFVERAAYPLVIGAKCMPLVALAPILAIWFGGSSLAGKAMMAGFICFFPVVVNMRTGLDAIEPEALDLFRSLSASRLTVLWKLRLPSSVGYLLSALKTSSTLAVVGAVVGEFAISDRGLGYRIVQASYTGNTVAMFASVVCLGVLGVAFFGVISLVELVLLRKFRLGVGMPNSQ